MELPALFKPEHSHSQALVLFESYLCYRTLLDVLSLRNSRWEHLVKLVYHLIKDVLDEECTEWLHLVQLSVSVRDALLFPNQNTFSVVLKCIKVNAELFSSDAVYKDFNDNLNRSIASYFVLTEKDKNKALEMCDMNHKLLGVVLAFPYISPLQRMELRFSKAPSHVLGKILEHLRCKVMEMQLPALAEMFNSLEGFVQVLQESEEIEGVANEMSSEYTELSTDEMEASSESIAASMWWGDSNTVTTINAMTTDRNSDIVDTEAPLSEGVCTDYRTKLLNVDARPDGVCKKYCLRSRNVDKDGPDGPSNYNRALPEKEETENSNSDVTSSSSDEISEEDEKEYFKPSDKPRHVKHRWTQLEIQNLLDGVDKFGVGNWSNIYLNYYFLPCRNPVSLKDKWRNMLKNEEVPEKYL